MRLQAAADSTHLLDADLLDGMNAVVDTTADTIVTPTKDVTTGAWNLQMTGSHAYVVVSTGSVKAQTAISSLD
ncbi:hypothetical protein [Actinomyces trachealis]|nr:hypothetical protein [Actinomyces trachealis]